VSRCWFPEKNQDWRCCVKISGSSLAIIQCEPRSKGAMPEFPEAFFFSISWDFVRSFFQRFTDRKRATHSKYRPSPTALTMAQPLEDDTLEKIHSYVKDMDINGTYVDMTEQLLMFRPENPIRFMVDYLSHKHKEQVRCYHLSLTFASSLHRLCNAALFLVLFKSRGCCCAWHVVFIWPLNLKKKPSF